MGKCKGGRKKRLNAMMYYEKKDKKQERKQGRNNTGMQEGKQKGMKNK